VYIEAPLHCWRARTHEEDEVTFTGAPAAKSEMSIAIVDGFVAVGCWKVFVPKGSSVSLYEYPRL
jgi:hypothetical protein